MLVVLLIFCQQTGFAHALTHLSNPAAPRPARSDTQHPAEKACTQCALYGQAANPLAGAPAGAPSVDFVSERASDAAFHSHHPAFAPHFLSRAPPGLPT